MPTSIHMYCKFQDRLSLQTTTIAQLSSALEFTCAALQAAVMILQSPNAPEVSAPQEDMMDLSESDRRKQVILSHKESLPIISHK